MKKLQLAAQQKTSWMPLIVAAIAALSFGLGYTIAKPDDHHNYSADAHMESGDMHGATAAHSTYEVAAAMAPSVAIEVTEDAKSGWNITLKTDKFTFAPQNVGSTNVMGEGHAHLYVDDVKVARLYGTSFHYPESFDGTKTFRVTLNANDHSEYVVDGSVIEARQTVTHKH